MPPIIPSKTSSVSMDDFTENSFANRGSPVPVISFGDKNYLDGPDDSDNGTPPSDQTRGGVFKKHAANFKDSFAKGHRRSTSGSSFSMQDRLLERCIIISIDIRKWKSVLTNAGCYNKSSHLKIPLQPKTTTLLAPVILWPLPLT